MAKKKTEPAVEIQAVQTAEDTRRGFVYLGPSFGRLRNRCVFAGTWEAALAYYAQELDRIPKAARLLVWQDELPKTLTLEGDYDGWLERTRRAVAEALA